MTDVNEKGVLNMERKIYCFLSHKNTKEILWTEVNADCSSNW